MTVLKMDRVDQFTPSTPSGYGQTVFYDPSPSHAPSGNIIYAQPVDPSLRFDPSNGHHNATIMTPHGQMVMPMSSAPSISTNMDPFQHPHDQTISPYDQHLMGHASMQMVVSPTDHLDSHSRHHAPLIHRHHSLPGGNGMNGRGSVGTQMLERRPNSSQNIQGNMNGSRPGMSRNHSIQVPPRPAGLGRQASLQSIQTRSASPHMMAGDVFSMAGSPVKRPSSVLGPADVLPQHHYEAQELFYHVPQGISPARAMGPPPAQPPRFSPQHNELMITPYGQKTGFYEQAMPSSATSVSSSSLSSQQETNIAELSDDENDSPTKGPHATRGISKLQLDDKAGPSRPRPSNIVVRPQRPGSAKPIISGGRTSAKFAKVAEDPGVEGIPPGPRPLDRPGPSFACIIGQAILRCSAGGLSLEHIYRYVETAYPFFKNDNPAWRNSVRHNLSIHKMFETIPRTEKFPPGKGGIWIIHEDEKCHWPEEDKFIKNFPVGHPHHEVCRQTQHDRAKERAQMEKAAKEGKIYIPKKGKKGRKLPNGEDGVDMIRTSSDMDFHFSSQGHLLTPQATPLMAPPPLPMDMEDEGEFLPVEEEAVFEFQEEIQPEVIEETKMMSGVIAPPRFERKEKKRLIEDEENVFTTGKRVRMNEPEPFAPLFAPPQPTVPLDDTFITPERERPANGNKIMSSAFKTPALVNTSSSPGSSPMPPTVTRATHHPSGLQQAWTHDDMAEIVNSSPQLPMLESAFDFQPAKASKIRARALAGEDDVPIISSANPPKTPLTRSSAAKEINKTPMLSKTPLTFGRSPAQPPPTVTALLSTPMWEMGGCLDRLKDYGSSPTRGVRSPVPPTSPTRYAMLLGASPTARKMRDFSL